MVVPIDPEGHVEGNGRGRAAAEHAVEAARHGVPAGASTRRAIGPADLS